MIAKLKALLHREQYPHPDPDWDALESRRETARRAAESL
jgi:hypothetical protein